MPKTPSGEYLTLDTNKSIAYNEGFAQGYLGLALNPQDHHQTSTFLTAYKNGTRLYWVNRGDAEGYYNVTPTTSEKNNSNYMAGWDQGNNTRADVGFDKNFYPSPNHTNDNYLDYLVGVYNGAVAADYDNNKSNTDGTLNYCPSGHTQVIPPKLYTFF